MCIIVHTMLLISRLSNCVFHTVVTVCLHRESDSETEMLIACLHRFSISYYEKHFNFSIATAAYFLFLFVVDDVEMVCILSESIVSLVLVTFV